MDAPNEAALGRALVRSLDGGVLATLSLELPGYPFGSLTPYVTTHEGQLVVYVSSIAQHTRNMQADPRVSLTVVEPGAGNRQALGRVTVVGDAALVPGPALAAVTRRYLRFFPEAEAYAGTHDFAFFWIVPRRVRYIGGFGRIFWIEADEWRLPSPEWAEQEQSILDHMNADHREALARIAAHHDPGRASNGGASDAPSLVAVDPEGVHLKDGESILYVPFSAAAFELEALRAAVIQLAREAGA